MRDMAVKNELAPIIIIKKKKIIKGGGHHGGAWKVAYADFVTAMMAFFLMMWLLSATTETQRKGLADYFSPTIPIVRISGGGDGVLGGDSVMTQEMLAQNGIGAAEEKPTEHNIADGDSGVMRTDSAGGEDGDAELKFTDIENMFRGDSGESTVADGLLQHVHTRVTDEGLIIELFDIEDSPLFLPGSSDPSEKMHLLLDMVADVVGVVTNSIAVSGHTDLLRADGGDAFLLSTEQAQLAMRLLVRAGVSLERISRVTGNADRAPVHPNAGIIRNRRIEITLLRRLVVSG